MNGRAPAILDHLASLADTTRSRILLLLDRHELTVSELCGIVQLPQSTVSRHLKALWDSGSRPAEGTSLYDHSATPRPFGAPALAAGARAGQLHESRGRVRISGGSRRSWRPGARVAGVLFLVGGAMGSAARGTLRSRISMSPRLRALPAEWVVGDLGCGTGQVSAALAPFVARVIAVDASAAMLQAARTPAEGVRPRRIAPRRARSAAYRRCDWSMPPR